MIRGMNNNIISMIIVDVGNMPQNANLTIGL